MKRQGAHVREFFANTKPGCCPCGAKLASTGDRGRPRKLCRRMVCRRRYLLAYERDRLPKTTLRAVVKIKRVPGNSSLRRVYLECGHVTEMFASLAQTGATRRACHKC